MTDDKKPMSDEPRTVLEGVDFNDIYARVFPTHDEILARLRKAASGVRGVHSGDFLECLASLFSEISQKSKEPTT
jgi:hypothetical protein